MDFGQILAASLSPDQIIREKATLALENASRENFTVYMSTLCRELKDSNKSSEVRQAAGVALKNALISKDAERLSEYEQRWLSIDSDTRRQMKVELFSTLESQDVRVGTAAAQATSAIARIELVRNEWPDLMEALMTSVQSPNENRRRCAVEAIGYICEEIEPTILEGQSDKILTAVVTGLRGEEPSKAVRAAAARALYNSLEFARVNFDRPHERDFIMKVVCFATQADDESIVLASFECLVRIISLYYHLMQPYMSQAVAELTIRAMSSSSENVTLQAIEFWSTVCDIERDLQDAGSSEFDCLFFAKHALPHLLPILLHLLCHEEEDDIDEWNKAMAASTCLSLLAECVRDEIFVGDIVSSFFQKNIQSTDWRNREAAVMAFGSVMDGPSSEVTTRVIAGGFQNVLCSIRDDSVAVRDTAAWAIGRVIDFYYEILPENEIPAIIQLLTEKLGDAPRVAVNCCWSLMSLYVHFGDDGNTVQTSIVSRQLPEVVNALYTAADRQDADEHNLRSAAYQSLSNVVLFSPMECTLVIAKLQSVMIEKLMGSLTLSNQIVSIDDQMRISEYQSLICTVLQNSLKKLGRPTAEAAGNIMTCCLHVLGKASCRGTELEDIMLLIGTLISEMEHEFLRFSDPFIPFLNKFVSNHEEYHLCMVAVGVVGDLARALHQNLIPYCDDLMRNLLGALQDAHLTRTVKPHVISSIGDVALGIGGSFVKYLPHVMSFFAQAASVAVSNNEDYDEFDFVCDIRESLLDAYTGIVQGLKDDQQALIALSPFVEQITNLIGVVANDTERSDAVVRAAIGLVGDLAHTYKTQMSPILRSEWLLHFIHNPLDENAHLSDSTLSVVKWTQEIVSQVVA